jgi:hypothetical protein
MTPKKATTTEVDFDDEDHKVFMPHAKSGREVPPLSGSGGSPQSAVTWCSSLR